MKAIIVPNYGTAPILTQSEIPDPVVGQDQILVRVRAFSINPFDVQLRAGKLKLFYPKKRPFVPGLDYAGEVVRTGPMVQGFQEGDKVYGLVKYNKKGTYQEFISVSRDEICKMPENLDFEQAAALPCVALTVLKSFREQSTLRPRQHIMVLGASGGVGHIAVQFIDAGGAHVTGVSSERNHDFVKSLGAEQTLDYKKNEHLSVSQNFDIIYDTTRQYAFSQMKDKLSPGGIMVTTSPTPSNFFNVFVSGFSDKKLRITIVKPNPTGLAEIKSMVEAGTIKPHIQKVFPLSEVVAAHQHVETGRTVGKVVVRFDA